MISVSFLRFLFTYDFYARISFFVSFTITSLLVLEVLRLVYTDANKREVEKLLDSYGQSRNYARPAATAGRRRHIPVDGLEKPMVTTDHCQYRAPSPAAALKPECSLIDGEPRRRRRVDCPSTAVADTNLPSPITVTVTQGQSKLTTSPPARRLRKRSDTPHSSSSGESRKLERRKRDPSVAASQNGSLKPARKARERDARHHQVVLTKPLKQGV